MSVSGDLEVWGLNLHERKKDSQDQAMKLQKGEKAEFPRYPSVNPDHTSTPLDLNKNPRRFDGNIILGTRFSKPDRDRL